METGQINITNFQKLVIKTVRASVFEVCIAVNPKYGFYHGNGDLIYESLFKAMAKQVHVKVIFSIKMDDDTWTDQTELIALGQLATKFLTYHPDIEFGYTWEGMSPNLIISDRKKVLATRLDFEQVARVMPHLFVYDDVHDVAEHIELFERLWLYAARPSDNYYLTLSGSPKDVFALSLIKGEWAKITEKIKENPNYLRSLGARDFEELVAFVIRPEMSQVILTPERGDGGRDIIAIKNTPLGQLMFLIECKHYSPDNLVGVEIVRQFYGVVELEKATAGIIVTSSAFTAGARDVHKSVAHRISLKDYKDLLSLLKDYRSRNV